MRKIVKIEVEMPGNPTNREKVDLPKLMPVNTRLTRDSDNRPKASPRPEDFNFPYLSGEKIKETNKKSKGDPSKTRVREAGLEPVVDTPRGEKLSSIQNPRTSPDSVASKVSAKFDPNVMRANSKLPSIKGVTNSTTITTQRSTRDKLLVKNTGIRESASR